MQFPLIRIFIAERLPGLSRSSLSHAWIRGFAWMRMFHVIRNDLMGKVLPNFASALQDLGSRQ
jgi:hypothetical protein